MLKQLPGALSRAALHRDHSGIVLARDGEGLKPVADGYVAHQNFFEISLVRRFHKFCIYEYAPHIIWVGAGRPGAVNL